MAALLTVSKLLSGFREKINDGVLRRSRWVRKSVTTGIQLPLSGLVVKGTVHLMPVESNPIMTRWRALKQEIHIFSISLLALGDSQYVMS